MSKLGELDLELPIPKFETYPSYFIGAGGMGYLIISWLMFYLDQYLPQGQGMEHFNGARFMAVDTAAPDQDEDLPKKKWKPNLFSLTGKLDDILKDVENGFFPGIADFYVDTPVARTARKQIQNDLLYGAATTRPFGRLGFFYNWSDFEAQLRQMIRTPIEGHEMRFGGNFNVIHPEEGSFCRRFIILSSLAGGTGSSCFLDIAATLRYVQEKDFKNESWIITGIFTLADVLAVDAKIDKELKKMKMKANTYAALKELNHFLDGNQFSARYGKQGEVHIKIPDINKDVTLFDQVFLVDTPNRDQRPLSGRKEVAQFLAQALMIFGTTSVTQGFYNRLVDTAAIMAFRQEYPASSSGEVIKEKQHSLFSSLGLSTLVLQTGEYLKYANYRLAAELLEKLFNFEPTGDPVQLAGQIANTAGLAETVLDYSFESCLNPVLDSRENCLDQVQQAVNPMETLRQFAANLEGMPTNEITRTAQQTTESLVQRLFPVSGPGPMEAVLKTLIGKGQLPAVSSILDELTGRLLQYKNHLDNELQEARIRSANREAPAGASGQPSGIIDNTTFGNILHAMETSWRNWGAALGRTIYRRWFFSRFEGNIRQAIGMLFDAQDLARILLIWEAKIQLTDSLVQKIRNLKEQFEQKLHHNQNILTELVRKQTQKEIGMLTAARSRFRETAVSPKDYYEKIFLLSLPGGKFQLINSWAEDIEGNGLTVAGRAGKVKIADWTGISPGTLATAISDYCWNNVIKIPPDPDMDLAQADAFFQIGLDSHLFLPSDRPSPFNQVLASWMAKAQVSLLFNDKLETSGYIISGCRTDGNFAWSKVLGMTGLTSFNGGPPNQASLFTFSLGFPLQQIRQISDWYEKAYVPQKRMSWPLHLFKEPELDLMVEPHLHWTELPDQQGAEELLELAQELSIISFSPMTADGEETVHIESRKYLLILPVRLRDFFFEYQPVAKGLDQVRLIKIFRENDKLLNALKHALRQRQATWDEAATVEDLINLAGEKELFNTGRAGQLYFNAEIYGWFASSQTEFCEAFFDKAKPVLKTINRNQLLLGLMRHEPLCRWLTKRVVRALLDPLRLDETQKRFRDHSFSSYLMELLNDYRP